jgi:hypothetical protein
MFRELRSRVSVRYVVFALLLAAGIYTSGCEYNISSHPPVQGLRVTVNPAHGSIETSSTLELTATVTGFASDSGVTWSFASRALGTLFADANAAIYTSPDSIAGLSDTVTVVATSREDQSKTASCVIVIFPAAVAGAPTISIDPVIATIQPGQTQQFTATVLNATDPSVTWSIVEGQGLISESGLYSAPASIVGNSMKATIRVTLNEDRSVWTAAEITVAPAMQPCYWNATRQIIQGNCMTSGCHGTLNPDREASDFTIAQNIVSSARQQEHGMSQLLYSLTSATGDDMMPRNAPALSADQLTVIRKWIEGGMDTTDCAMEPGQCDTSGVKYSVFVRATIQNACLGCHNGAGSTGKYDLSKYDGVAAVAHTGQLVGAISHSFPFRAMPDGGTKLDDCTISKIRAWVNAGALNN